MGGALLRNLGLGLVAAAILAAICVMACRSQPTGHFPRVFADAGELGLEIDTVQQDSHAAGACSARGSS